MQAHPFHRDDARGGFSLVELMVVATIMIALLYGVSVLGISGQRANRHAARATRAMELNQEVLDSIRHDLEAAIELFGNNPRGLRALEVMSRDGMPGVLPDSRLPSPSSAGVLQADTSGNEITGNQLLVARLAWADEFTTTAGNTFRVDVMRWVHYHLADDQRKGFELVRWVGEPMADGAQIAGITDPDDQAEVCLHLREGTPDRFGASHSPCVIVWDRREDLTTGSPFQQITSTGLLEPEPESVPFRTGPDWVVLTDPAYPDVGFYIRRQFAVVENDALDAIWAGSHALLDNTGAGFPHGFEVQVVGPTSARVVMLRLAIYSRLMDDSSAWSSLKTLVHVREQ